MPLAAGLASAHHTPPEEACAAPAAYPAPLDPGRRQLAPPPAAVARRPPPVHAAARPTTAMGAREGQSLLQHDIAFVNHADLRPITRMYDTTGALGPCA